MSGAVDYDWPGKRGAAKVRVRPWEPGDGLACAHVHTKQANGRPDCGPPAAVVFTAWHNGVPRKRVVCALHFPGVLSAGDIHAAAVKVATEAVVAAHWDEYQARFTAERDRLVGEAVEFVDASMRAVLDADGPRSAARPNAGDGGAAP